MGALNEGGDIVQAVASGAFSATDIQADLFELCRGGGVGPEIRRRNHSV